MAIPPSENRGGRASLSGFISEKQNAKTGTRIGLTMMYAKHRVESEQNRFALSGLLS